MQFLYPIHDKKCFKTTKIKQEFQKEKENPDTNIFMMDSCLGFAKLLSLIFIRSERKTNVYTPHCFVHVYMCICVCTSLISTTIDGLCDRSGSYKNQVADQLSDFCVLPNLFAYNKLR
jgi:hypothetical protein